MMKVEKDPFLVDMDQMTVMASEQVIRRGIQYFQEGRVREVWVADSLRALVEGSNPDWPYQTEWMVDDDDRLAMHCTCPFNCEPVCKHGIATLLAHAELNDTKVIQNARDQALADRENRGKRQVKVAYLGGFDGFGLWRAESLLKPFGDKAYEVQIRSRDKRENVCECPDFEINLLGTCKHIEAVLHRMKKRRTQLRPQKPYMFLDRQDPTEPQIKIRFPSEGVVPADLSAYFHEDGRFKASVPDGFFRFQSVFGNRVQICSDCTRHVQRLVSQQAAMARQAELGSLIQERGGHIRGIKAQLYPYQMEGVAFLAGQGRALLADDMGLGKTLQAISAAVWLMEQGEVVRALIVCPASLKAQWAREIEKFSGRSVRVIQGKASERMALYASEADFMVANYELVIRDAVPLNDTWMPDLVILDEAQRVKNWRTKMAQSIRRLNSRFLFVLTGTPLENRLEDLFSLVQLVDPHRLGPLWRFMLDFHVLSESGRVLGYRNLGLLRRRLKPVMLRRDRSLVSHQLPERIVQTLDVPMTQHQRDLMGSALAGASELMVLAQRRKLTPGEEKRLLGALQTARMACNAAFLVDQVTPGSPKIDEMVALLKEAMEGNDLKAVVFSQWERMTEMAEHALKVAGLGSIRLFGHVPTRSRGALIQRFQEDPEVRVFISTDAGGVGLNLQNASLMVNLDLPWNPAVLNQRFARIHRLGQKNKVLIMNLVAEDSYENRIGKLIQSKDELFREVMDPNAVQDGVGLVKRDLDAMLQEIEPFARRDVEVEGPDVLAELDVSAALANTELKEPTGLDPLQELVACLDRVFGNRVESVLGTSKGILAVLSEWNTVDQSLVEPIRIRFPNVPIGIVDTATFYRLQAMGEASPWANYPSLLDRPQNQSEPSPLARTALRKWRSAEVLAASDCGIDSVRLLLESVVCFICGRAGQVEPPEMGRLATWCMEEAEPKGWITAVESQLITKLHFLASAPEIPPGRAIALVQEVRTMVMTD